MNCQNCSERTDECPCPHCGYTICKNSWEEGHEE